MAEQKQTPSLTDELPDKDVHELTQSAYDRLKAEYEELTTVKKIDIARKIEAARELGDLSENGDYHAAKEEQGKMAGRISHIHSILENHVMLMTSRSSTRSSIEPTRNFSVSVSPSYRISTTEPTRISREPEASTMTWFSRIEWMCEMRPAILPCSSLAAW